MATFDHCVTMHSPQRPPPAAPSSPPTTTTHLDAFASPTPTPAAETLNPKAGVDDDWAAFVNGSVEPPTAQPAAPTDEWDAFQGGESAATAAGSDPFGTSSELLIVGCVFVGRNLTCYPKHICCHSTSL